MILYHGSSLAIPQPDLDHSRSDVDFGRGFYTTPYREQAVQWCNRLKRRHQPAVVSQYQCDESGLESLQRLQFDTYSEAWLDFVMTCRRGEDTTAYDLVVGGVANDRVFNTVELYFDALIDKAEAIRRLRFEKPNLQLCFRTPKALACLSYAGSEAV